MSGWEFEDHATKTIEGTFFSFFFYNITINTYEVTQ